MRFTTAILLGILFCWGGVSCKKEYSIKIKVNNPVTGEPYKNTRVEITERSSDIFDGWGGSKTELLYEGYTNDNGEILVTEKFHKDRSYMIWCERPGGYEGTCYMNHAGGYAIFKDGRSDKEINFELLPCASLKLKINNVNCQGVNDSISVFRELMLENHETWSATNPYTQVGCQQTISPSFFTVPMGEYHFWWNVTKNNVTNTYHDTVYFSADEHKIYEINY